MTVLSNKTPESMVWGQCLTQTVGWLQKTVFNPAESDVLGWHLTWNNTPEKINTINNFKYFWLEFTAISVFVYCTVDPVSAKKMTGVPLGNQKWSCDGRQESEIQNISGQSD